ncbi:MAG TPA: DUF2169 domain-containing protein [Longimicrobiales bacterium]|jgi:hypothetical protein
MLQLSNDTGLEGLLFVAPDPDGVESVYAIIKGSFRLARSLELLEEQVPIRTEDEWTGEPGQSGIALPADVGLPKPGADLLVVGNAWPERGRARYVDVQLAAGTVQKAVRAWGNRVWRSDGQPTEPDPFEFMPLVWERAFGGVDDTGSAVDAELRNPVGIGVRARDSARPLDGYPLPNLENPSAPLLSWQDRPPPAGVGAVAPSWEPRRSWAGTYDERWQAERAPYLPLDFDPRFLHQASPDQILATHVGPGEWVDLIGASRRGRDTFQIPTWELSVTFRAAGGDEEKPARLDTVLIEPEEERVCLVWRAGLATDKDTLRLKEVVVERVGAGGES